MNFLFNKNSFPQDVCATPQSGGDVVDFRKCKPYKKPDGTYVVFDEKRVLFLDKNLNPMGDRELTRSEMQFFKKISLHTELV